MNHVDGDHDDHKRYIEDYLWNGQKPGVQRLVMEQLIPLV